MYSWRRILIMIPDPIKDLKSISIIGGEINCTVSRNTANHLQCLQMLRTDILTTKIL